MDFNHDSGTISSILALDPGANSLTISGTGGLILPAGTTAQRPASTGILRFNTDTSLVEGYNGASWTTLQITTSNLTGLSSLSGTGIIAQTGAGTFANRTITGSSGNVTVTNGDGISGNPTINLATAGTPGTYVSVTTDTFGRVTSGSTTQVWGSITGTPTTLSGYGITDSVKNNGSAGGLQAGVFASRPTAGTAGNFYFSTNTNALYYDTGAAWSLASPAITGDIAISAGATTSTLATVNSNVGVFGSASAVPQFTVNAKGLITAVSNVTITTAAIGAIASSLLGAANGVATLDATGKLTGTQIPAALVGALVYQGTWNATTNSPTLASGVGTKGQYYKVSVAGTTTIDGNSAWAVGDMIVFNGTTWDAIDGLTTEVTSVFGRVGAVTATLASADFVNQGTTTTVLHGNAAGNPTWAAINLAADVTGVLPMTSTGALTGDVAKTSGASTTTLATVNATTGAFGSATQVPTFVVNGKGLVTSAANVAIPNTVALTGDGTASVTTGSSGALTLATVNSNVGQFGNATNVPQFTVNAKGLVTAVANVAITASGLGAVSNAGGSPSLKQGLASAIGAAGTAGALYVATDTKQIFRDNGATWDQISEASLLYTENPSSPAANTVTGTNAVAIGSGASTAINGGKVTANGFFTAAGDAQSGKYILRTITANATQTEVFLDGSSARIVLPNNSATTYSALVVARRTDVVGSEAAFKIEGLISRDATVGSTALVGNRSRTILTRPNANWDADVFADTTNGALTFKVTGQASQTIRWVVTVTTSEVIN